MNETNFYLAEGGGIMALFSYVEINGKRISLQKYDEMMEKSVNNVILSGFDSEEKLIDAIYINAYGNNQMAMRLLIKLLGIYQKQIEDESLLMFQETTPCYNILEISKKMKMLYHVLDTMTQEALDSFKNKKQEIHLLEDSGYEDDEDEYEDPDDPDGTAYYDDEDEYEEESESTNSLRGSTNLDMNELFVAAARNKARSHG